MNTQDNAALEQLQEYGSIWINHWSTDCDGCTAASYKEFASMESLEAWIQATSMDCEGSWGWEYTTPNNLVEHAPVGYWGM